MKHLIQFKVNICKGLKKLVLCEQFIIIELDGTMKNNNVGKTQVKTIARLLFEFIWIIDKPRD